MPVINDGKNIFIHCPFDDGFDDILHADIFSIMACGFVPRCTKECEDASEVRIERLVHIISQCMYGVHDISRTAISHKTKLPRLTMPFE